eukprot:17999-Heterococcus_DN1.PRE.3
MYCRNTLTEAFPQGPPGPIDVYRTIKKVWLQLAQPAYSIFNFLLCDGITMFAVSASLSIPQVILSTLAVRTALNGAVCTNLRYYSAFFQYPPRYKQTAIKLCTKRQFPFAKVKLADCDCTVDFATVANEQD